MLVTWLIVLIAGRMPRPLHEALAAAVRYEVRLSGYFLMLTAQYPGGLFGDPATSAFGAGPAGGEFASGPEGLAVQEGFPEGQGSSQVPGDAGPGWGPWGQPESGQPGYGGAAAAAAGHGEPAAAYGYGQPAAPVRWLGGGQPWRLVLSRQAKRLVALFLVLGVIFAVGYGVLIAVIASTSGNNTVTRAEAAISVESAFATLSGTLSGFDSKVAACQGRFSCVNKVDAQMSRAFGRFAQDMNGIPMPSGAPAAAADRVRSDASQTSEGFTRLSKVTSGAQYEQVVASTGLEGLLRRFDTDYQALGVSLGVR